MNVIQGNEVIEFIIKNKDWIFSGVGIFLVGGIISAIKFVLRRRERTRSQSVANTNELPNYCQQSKKYHNIEKEEVLIIEALKSITAPDDALPIKDISKMVGLDIPTTTHFLNHLKALSIVGGPYIMGEGPRYLLTERGFQIYYEMNKTRKENDSKVVLPKWLKGEDVMRYYDLSHDLLMQYVRKGLKVYPAGEDVLFFDDEVPALGEDELAFEANNDDYSNYRFKKQDVEDFIRKGIT